MTVHNPSKGVFEMMRRCTGRNIMLAIAGLLLIRILWSWTNRSQDDQDQEMASFIAGHKDPLIRNFKPSSCVMVDGKCVPHNEGNLDVPSRGLIIHDGRFYLDGQPFTILSGSFHYFRTHPLQWGDRLLKMKAAGLNTVMTYIPWNLHEKIKGEYKFSELFDLMSFLRHVHQVGLKAIVRPGPYICAEWDWGGLPSWLLHDPNMVVRSSSYKPYLKHVEEYFSHLLPILANYQYSKKQGPIIAFQIENEFGSYSNDPEYMDFLKGLFEQHGLKELYFTSDGPKQLVNGTIPGVYATVNFKNDPAEKLKELKEFQPNKPLMVTEYWAGWFDYWNGKHNAESPSKFEERVEIILKHNASINFYMFEGGTTFGFMNGANWVENELDPYRPQVTSYDYDSPLTEAGDVTDKFQIVRDLITKLKISGPYGLPQIPRNTPKAAYGRFPIQDALSYQDMLSYLPTDHVMNLPDPIAMEYLNINNNGGQGYGWILYRNNNIPKGAKSVRIMGTMADRTQVLVNGKEERVIDINVEQKQFELFDTSKDSNTLDLFVENCGRINFKKLNGQRKGIQGNIFIDGKKTSNWQHVPFEFKPDFLNALSADKNKWKSADDLKGPAIYRTYFSVIGSQADTFLDMRSWSKGIVFINKFNLGRYWNAGPTKTLFVPGPVLVNGQNEVLIFELHKPATEVVFRNKPDLGPLASQ